MAWKSLYVAGAPRNVAVMEEESTLPSSATTEYSSAIPGLTPNLQHANFYVTFWLQASAVTGTNLDIGIYGALTESGTKFLLLDALVADITDGTAASAVKDINLYPAPFYFIGWTSDADEDANTITCRVAFQNEAR